MANKKKVHDYTEEFRKEAVRRADQKGNHNQSRIQLRCCRTGYFHAKNLTIGIGSQALWRQSILNHSGSKVSSRRL